MMMDLLEHKLRLSRMFQAATEELSSCIAADRDEGVGDLVLRRQACIDGINAIDRQLAKAAPARDPRRAEAVRSAIREVLSGVGPLDEECAARLKSRIGAAQDEIARLQRGRTGFQGYGQGRTGANRLCSLRT